ncbi:transport system permease protein [Halothece sp. PCC 7418]|uniref:FecCD family ABC transporter permease n=1 Tax=Halothece sp. (strain PCC 7418) TaxID=65093 RepID=UPI0002A08A41|nr:iron ABC transporter permease [Halothece sp. PCC 7418]AFZ44176.1 transport system permease protein [Halothece sp. PCC 7418]
MKSPWLVIRLQKIPLSFRIHRRVPIILLILAVATLLVMIISVSYGEYPVPPLATVKTILGQSENSDYGFIIRTLRLPRTLVAFGVGVGLAIAGTITQGITRNPLAAPDIIGVNAGASLAAVTLLVLLPTVSIALLPVVAFLGGLMVAVLIYLLAWQGGSSPIRLILVGIGLNLIASALTNLMITFGNINTVSQALVWLTGSVYGRSWEQLLTFLPWLVIFGLLALGMARNLNVLSLGDETARGLGNAIEWQRGILLLTSVALASASVATAGSIGFVGLMAPHLSRQLVGGTYAGQLPTAGMIGGLLVVIADLLGRMLLAPTELPCGLITAAVGAPFFIYLLIRKR